MSAPRLALLNMPKLATALIEARERWATQGSTPSPKSRHSLRGDQPGKRHRGLVILNRAGFTGGSNP